MLEEPDYGVADGGFGGLPNVDNLVCCQPGTCEVRGVGRSVSPCYFINSPLLSYLSLPTCFLFTFYIVSLSLSTKVTRNSMILRMLEYYGVL